MVPETVLMVSKSCLTIPKPLLSMYTQTDHQALQGTAMIQLPCGVFMVAQHHHIKTTTLLGFDRFEVAWRQSLAQMHKRLNRRQQRSPLYSHSFKLRLLDAKFREPGLSLRLGSLRTQDSPEGDGPLGAISDAKRSRRQAPLRAPLMFWPCPTRMRPTGISLRPLRFSYT